MTQVIGPFIAVVPAAGVGKRMKADCPKQYLEIEGITILEHTVNKLLDHPAIEHVILALGEFDQYFPSTSLVNNPKVTRVNGGKERVDSVKAGLEAINVEKYPWVLVHDAARPCVASEDISALIKSSIARGYGGILASPVRDTMKRSNEHLDITLTEERELLWHALTPQFYRTDELKQAIEHGLSKNLPITDESSAIELMKLPSHIVEGRGDNIKITHPDDLAYASFILSQQKNVNLTKERENI